MFLKITEMQFGFYDDALSDNNNFAVVRQFEEETKELNDNYSALVRYGSLRNYLNLIHCSQIENVCAIVPNIPCEKESSKTSINALVPQPEAPHARPTPHLRPTCDPVDFWRQNNFVRSLW